MICRATRVATRHFDDMRRAGNQSGWKSCRMLSSPFVRFDSISREGIAALREPGGRWICAKHASNTYSLEQPVEFVRRFGRHKHQRRSGCISRFSAKSVFALSRLVRFRRSEGYNWAHQGSAWTCPGGGCRRPANGGRRASGREQTRAS